MYVKFFRVRKIFRTQVFVGFPVFSTPCLSTSAESTPESSPMKMRPTKSVPGEKGLDFLPSRCVLVISVTPREILNC